MIRIVGYLVPDSSMPHAKTSAWFTIWEAPPNISASRALKQAAARMVTWEQRLKLGSYNGTTRIAVEAGNAELEADRIRVLEVEAGWGAERASGNQSAATVLGVLAAKLEGGLK